MPGQRSPVDMSVQVRTAQEGDEAAFGELFRAVQPGLLRYLGILVGVEAKDVAAETWLQVARDLASFHGDYDGFRGWVATIGRNRALGLLRSRRRRPVSTVPAEGLLGDRPAADDTEGAALSGIGTSAALALIATLPRDQAEAVLLRVVMDLAPVPVPPRPRRQPMLTSALTKVLSAKVASAAVATALGGVAVAAGTGHLPAALGGGPAGDRPAQAQASATASPSVPPNTTRRTAAPLPADLAELCRAYGRARDADPGEAPAEPRFTALVKAAGGPDHVPGYCAPALEDSGSPSAAPATTDRPSDARPSGRPTSRPQPPDNRPSGPAGGRTPGASGSHPSGPPDDKPSAPPGTGGVPTSRPKG